MKRLLPLVLTSTMAVYFAASVQGAILLDDKFLLGNRTNQNLTSSSAWFANSSAILTNAVGNMTWVVPASSCMGLTYFMPQGNPSALKIGDTLKVTLTYSNIGVNANNTAGGLRFGLYNYAAGGTRITADGFSTTAGNGNNVQGSMEIINVGQTRGVTNALRLYKRFQVFAHLLSLWSLTLARNEKRLHSLRDGRRRSRGSTHISPASTAEGSINRACANRSRESSQVSVQAQFIAPPATKAAGARTPVNGSGPARLLLLPRSP